MALTNAFRDYLAARVTGNSAAALFDNSNAYIGVGDSTTAFAASQTDLQAATNKFRKAMDATYPQASAGAMTFRSTFATGDANFAWQEWGVFNASSAGTMMNRVVANNGTKANTETKQVTVTLTLSV
jgi:hypothetical protein